MSHNTQYNEQGSILEGHEIQVSDVVHMPLEKLNAETTAQDDQSDVGEECYEHAIHQIDDLAPFIDLTNELDKMSKQGRINDMRRRLVVFVVGYVTTRVKEAERLARIDAAKDATQSAIYVLTGSDDFRIEPGVNLGLNVGQITKLRQTLYRMKDAYQAQALTTTTNGKGE